MVETVDRHPARPAGGSGRRAGRVAALAAAAALTGMPVLGWSGSARAQDDAPAGTARPTVSMTKTFSPQQLAPGDEVTFTVRLTNTSGADATGYVIDSLAPTELGDLHWTCAATGAASRCGVTAGEGELADTFDVGTGGEVVYLITATLSPGASGTFTQRVILVPGPGQACDPVNPDLLAELPTRFGPRDRGGERNRAGFEAAAGPVVSPAEQLAGRPTEQDADPYPTPPAGGGMVCVVNNELTPRVAAGPPPGRRVPPQPEAPNPPVETLPRTGTPTVAYLGGGLLATLTGAALLWFTRRRWAR